MAAKPAGLSGFCRGRTPNGIIVSTCLHCGKVAGSTCPENLQMAEQVHRCIPHYRTQQRLSVVSGQNHTTGTAEENQH